MKVDLITKTDAVTVLLTFFPEENWHDLIEDQLDVYRAEEMEFLLKEDLIEFVVIHTKPVIEPMHARLFCSGLIAGIEAEADRHFYAEMDQVLEALGYSLGGSPTTATGETNTMEVA